MAIDSLQLPSTLPLHRPVVSGRTRSTRSGLTFSGNGAEYFRIWAVNLVLTLCTLGLYWPWAKVRRMRYLHRHTQLDGSPFDYHGRPMALLKGRLLALAVLAIYLNVAKLGLTPALQVNVLLLGVIMPWLLWNGTRFKLANTSYRGIRFEFRGSLKQAYAVYLPLLLFVFGPWTQITNLAEVFPTPDPELMLGLLACQLIGLGCLPLFYHRLCKYQFCHAAVGNYAFCYQGKAIEMVRLIFPLPAILLILVTVALALFWQPLAALGQSVRLVAGVALLISALALVVMIAIAIPYYRTATRNLVWNNTTLGGVVFHSTLTIGGWTALLLKNTLYTLLTLGLYRPWAVISFQRYRVENLSWAGDTSEFHRWEADLTARASGAESAALFDLEPAL